jgi:hypothetical protein
MRKLIALALLLLAMPVWGASYYRDTLTKKKSGSTLLEVMPAASVNVYQVGSSVSSATNSGTMIVDVYSSGTFQVTDSTTVHRSQLELVADAADCCRQFRGGRVLLR